ncbi:MAG TPA: hypothetical protein VJR67_01160 [Candidatus Nitrosopolaris sp.]|nr:hypothetical protein [Candidatus Nitrosopolaris sp.]
MTKEETSQYALRAVVRATTHEDFEIKLGRLRYSVGKYDRMTRATIPIPPTETTDNDDKSSMVVARGEMERKGIGRRGPKNTWKNIPQLTPDSAHFLNS